MCCQSLGCGAASGPQAVSISSVAHVGHSGIPSPLPAMGSKPVEKCSHLSRGWETSACCWCETGMCSGGEEAEGRRLLREKN